MNNHTPAGEAGAQELGSSFEDSPEDPFCWTPKEVAEKRAVLANIAAGNVGEEHLLPYGYFGSAVSRHAYAGADKGPLRLENIAADEDPAINTAVIEVVAQRVKDRADRRRRQNAEWMSDLFPGAAPFIGSRIEWGEMWASPDAGDDWLIRPLIASGRGHALYAPAKARKSLFALHVCACAASGRPVLDYPGGWPVQILYIDMEMGTSDVRERLTSMGFGPWDDLDAFAYYSLPSLAMLDSAEGGDQVLDLANAHGAQLVVIDTTSRVIGGEENSADTMRAFFRHTGSRLKAQGIAMLRLDHAGKEVGKGMRGTSAKADDVDVVWELKAQGSSRLVLKATHRRMGWVPEAVHLEQTSEPLAFQIAADSRPPDVVALVGHLDRLGIPDDAGRPSAQVALSAAGVRASNDRIGEAVKTRKARTSTGGGAPTNEPA
ncbi:MAG: hypothetical protein JWO77_1439 [Ilumatobacteraceae bacterium]|nr:hypothetical protein [Ilumatobacteraceae bacterium]